MKSCQPWCCAICRTAAKCTDLCELSRAKLLAAHGACDSLRRGAPGVHLAPGDFLGAALAFHLHERFFAVGRATVLFNAISAPARRDAGEGLPRRARGTSRSVHYRRCTSVQWEVRQRVPLVGRQTRRISCGWQAWEGGMIWAPRLRTGSLQALFWDVLFRSGVRGGPCMR